MIVARIQKFLGHKFDHLLGPLVILLTAIATAIVAVVRTLHINPVILGDEFIYAMNAKYFSFWTAPIAGNFSNDLFSFVYSTTALCGEAFYQCGKLLNGGFFAVFVGVLGLLTLRVTGNKSASFIATVVIGLSPASVYVSMFLPETMFFAFMALALSFSFEASRKSTPKSWALVGATLGLASLVKPHAWMAFIAVSVFALTKYIAERKVLSASFLRSGLAFVSAAIGFRILASVALSGPMAFNFFGQYVTANTFEEVASVTQGASGSSSGSLVGAGEIEGVIGLFPSQLWIHWVSLVSILGFSLYLLFIRVLSLPFKRSNEQLDQLAVLIAIWLLTLLIMIVMFTGWITGGGDDHTTRILLRYYDYAFAFTVVGAVSVGFDSYKQKAALRWGLAIPFLATSSLAFAGFHSRLTVQIADAPGLAGVVGNSTIYGLASGVILLSLAVFAAFPRFSRVVVSASLLATLVPFGYEAVNQYDLARGIPREQDKAGMALAQTLNPASKSSLVILSSTRFEATGVALYGDAPEAEFLFFAAGSVVPMDYVRHYRFAVLLDGIELVEEIDALAEGEGYRILGLKE